MFGYITACTEALSKEEAALYRSYYCGLCAVLGERFGKKGKLALSHDLVFLAILYNGLYEEETKEESGLCLLKKGVRTEKRTSGSFAYAADMNLLLAYGNYKDRVYDGGSNKRAARAALSLLKKDFETVQARYPRQSAAVEAYLTDLHAAEKSTETNADIAANLSGRMLSEVFLMKEDEFAAYLRPCFYHLGRFVYLADAYEDVEKDLKEGQYNPYAPYRGREDFSALVKAHLTEAAGMAARSFEMLPILKNTTLLRNILYTGIWMGFARAEKARTEKKGTQHVL